MSNAQLYATMTHAAFLQAVFREEMILQRGLVSPRLSWKAFLGSDYFLASSAAKHRLCPLCSCTKRDHFIGISLRCPRQPKWNHTVCQNIGPVIVLITCDPLFVFFWDCFLSCTSSVSLKLDYCLLPNILQSFIYANHTLLKKPFSHMHKTPGSFQAGVHVRTQILP